MSPLHHPSDALLLDLAAGRFEHGPALVLRAHLEACPACRAVAGGFESLGGALLEALPAAAMEPDALDRALARIETKAPALAAKLEVGLPRMLAGQDFGPRRWVAPGLWLRRLQAAPGERFNTYLLHSSPGWRFPRHGHVGAEYVCVLEGGFSDSTGCYVTGDFAEGDEELVHEPLAERGEACLCLISTEGRMRMQGLIARVLQPLVGL